MPASATHTISRTGAVLATASLVLALAALPGCSDTEVLLLSARFMDENSDGAVQAGETILLTFSAELQLDDEEIQTGVSLVPEGHSLGRYRVRRAPDDGSHQLRVEIGEFDLRVHPEGIHGEPSTPEASGIIVDLDRMGSVRAGGGVGQRLTARFGPVDIGRARPRPAQLERVDWVDVDENLAVSTGDQLRLYFDRAVRISDTIKSRRGVVPDDLFILPIAGDRLDNGIRGPRRSALQENNGEPRCLTLILGSRPRLTAGEAEVTSAAPVSRIAINGTSIRPHRGIVDDLGNGVMSDGAIAIEVLAGTRSPFRVLPGFLAPGLTLEGHSVTSFPDGRVLVAGGLIGDETKPHNGVWLFDPDIGQAGEWRVVTPGLKWPRFGHTATYMPGIDLTLDTGDDLVLIAGGYDGEKPLNDLEVLRVAEGVVEPFYLLDQQLSTRFYHTAHAVPDTNGVVFVGGQEQSHSLNPTVELLEIEESPETGSAALVSRLCTLKAPRILHESVLYDRGESGPVILIFGGLGQPPGATRRLLTSIDTEVLAAPEVVVGLGGGNSLSVLLETDADSPEPPARWGHRLVLLEEERADVLLIGGTIHHPMAHFGTDLPDPQRCATGYRLDFELAPEARIRYLPTGDLNEPRYNFAVGNLPGGRVFIVGGEVSSEAALGSAELFDLGPGQAGFQTLTGQLLAPRAGAGIAPVAGTNRWLIVGGAPASRNGDVILVEEIRWPD